VTAADLTRWGWRFSVTESGDLYTIVGDTPEDVDQNDIWQFIHEHACELVPLADVPTAPSVQ
jgi:hypothetical protein